MFRQLEQIPIIDKERKRDISSGRERERGGGRDSGRVVREGEWRAGGREREEREGEIVRESGSEMAIIT